MSNNDGEQVGPGWGTAEHWMRMQASYELAQARRERATGEQLADVTFASATET